MLRTNETIDKKRAINEGVFFTYSIRGNVRECVNRSDGVTFL